MAGGHGPTIQLVAGERPQTVHAGCAQENWQSSCWARFARGLCFTDLWPRVGAARQKQKQVSQGSHL